MWLVAAIAFTAAGVVAQVACEIARNVVNAKRVRATGIGGTQDIAIWGMVITAGCLVASVVCWVGWFLTR